MNPIGNVVLGLSLTFLCTALGSSLVFFFRGEGLSRRWNQLFLGFAAGVMFAASLFSLLLPAIETEVSYLPSIAVASLGLILGVLFLYLLDRIVPHLHVQEGKEEGVGRKRLKKTTKMFLAVTLHNVPEGLSVGIAYGVALLSNGDLSAALMAPLILAIGIGIQNLPEGAVVSLSMRQEMSAKKAFLYGTFSGIVEPLAGVVGLFLAYFAKPILPWALSFAAGTMIYVIIEEMIPDMKEEPDSHFGLFAFLAGFVLMMVLDVTLG